MYIIPQMQFTGCDRKRLTRVQTPGHFFFSAGVRREGRALAVGGWHERPADERARRDRGHRRIRGQRPRWQKG